MDFRVAIRQGQDLFKVSDSQLSRDQQFSKENLAETGLVNVIQNLSTFQGPVPSSSQSTEPDQTRHSIPEEGKLIYVFVLLKFFEHYCITNGGESG